MLRTSAVGQRVHRHVLALQHVTLDVVVVPDFRNGVVLASDVNIHTLMVSGQGSLDIQQSVLAFSCRHNSSTLQEGVRWQVIPYLNDLLVVCHGVLVAGVVASETGWSQGVETGSMLVELMFPETSGSTTLHIRLVVVDPEFLHNIKQVTSTKFVDKEICNALRVGNLQVWVTELVVRAVTQVVPETVDREHLAHIIVVGRLHRVKTNLVRACLFLVRSEKSRVAGTRAVSFGKGGGVKVPELRLHDDSKVFVAARSVGNSRWRFT